MPTLSHTTSCTPNKSNIYLVNSLAAAAAAAAALYRLLTLQIPNLMSLFRCLVRNKVSVQSRGKCSCFVTNPIFSRGIFHIMLNSQDVGLPLVFCSRPLIQYIRI